MIILFLYLIIPILICARSGLDLSTPCYNFPCLLKEGYTSAITRALKNTGELDENAQINIKNARAAGFLSVDVYISPCRGRDPISQVEDLFRGMLSIEGEDYHMVWISLDSNPWIGCGWSSYSIISNCEFLKKMVQNIELKGKKVGIFSNKEKWIQIFGNEDFCKEFTNYPLWYAHIDQDQSFNDWNMVRFGGWIKPSIKQYNNNLKSCECLINSNFF